MAEISRDVTMRTHWQTFRFWFWPAFLVVVFTVVNVVGISMTFAFYALACVVGLLFSFYYVPETKGLSLERIEKHIRSSKPLRLLGKSD